MRFSGEEFRVEQRNGSLAHNRRRVTVRWADWRGKHHGMKTSENWCPSFTCLPILGKILLFACCVRVQKGKKRSSWHLFKEWRLNWPEYHCKVIASRLLPSCSGDVFAFDSTFNNLFSHAIPVAKDAWPCPGVQWFAQICVVQGNMFAKTISDREGRNLFGFLYCADMCGDVLGLPNLTFNDCFTFYAKMLRSFPLRATLACAYLLSFGPRLVMT